MPRWFLVALLYADGQMAKEIALQLGVSKNAAYQYIKRAKGELLGATRHSEWGTAFGVGSRMELRAVLVEDGWLTEPELVS